MEKIKQEKEEMAKKREQTAWLGGSILDRHTRVPNNPNAIIRLPENYRMDSVAEKDLTTSSNAPTSFDVPVIQVNNGEASRGTKHDENDNERLVASNSLLVPDRVSIEYKDDEEAVPAASTSSGSPFSMAVPVISVSNDNKAVTILLSKKRTSLGKGLFILRNLGKTSVFIFELIHGTWNPMRLFFFVSNDNIGIAFIWVYLFIYLSRHKYFWRKRLQDATRSQGRENFSWWRCSWWWKTQGKEIQTHLQ